MKNVQPLFDPATHYRIMVRGRVDPEWLQAFDSLATIRADETEPLEEITVLEVHTDQAGIVGLVRRLHGRGISILKLQILDDRGNADTVERPC
jgi:hypothetical protein